MEQLEAARASAEDKRSRKGRRLGGERTGRLAEATEAEHPGASAEANAIEKGEDACGGVETPATTAGAKGAPVDAAGNDASERKGTGASERKGTC